jgi:hypothetical protein
MKKLNVDLDDFKTSTLKRIIKQLLVAPEGDEEQILSQLSQGASRSKADAEKESNDLADLVEEKRGKPGRISADGDDVSDEPDGDEDDRLYTRKKKGKA